MRFGDVGASLPRLIVITDRRATGEHSLLDVVQGALGGGARLLQLREKDLDGGPLLELARSLLTECARYGARLLVNDRIDVALAAEAHGVVLPADSFPTDVARRLVGARLVGRSTHSAPEVERAAGEGCDFSLFGPVFDTPSKSRYGAPQGLQRLHEATQAPIPVYAVGGVTAVNANEVIRAGAHGVAVIREVMSAPDPRSAVERLLASLG